MEILRYDDSFFSISYVFIAFYFILALLAGLAGLNKNIGFRGTFIASVFLTPLTGLFLALISGLSEPPGCLHCDNRDNEAEYCNFCGKNIPGESKAS